MFSYRISGKSDVITAFFEGYDKAVRPGFGKIQETMIKKKEGERKSKLNIYQQLFKWKRPYHQRKTTEDIREMNPFHLLVFWCVKSQLKSGYGLFHPIKYLVIV